MPWTNPLLPGQATGEALRNVPDGLRLATYAQALREAQAQLLQMDPRVFLFGEGIDDPGGVFGSTTGLAETFGPKRVLDSPIAENGMTGVAIGAALAGMRPIHIHMRADFLPMAMDQLINHAAKWRYMTGGQAGVPLVVRSIIGRGWGSAAQHSQGLHGLFLHVPGLKVALPASPYDAKGLLCAAVEDPDPVLIMEHRWLYDTQGPVPDALYTVPFGQAVVRHTGDDATVVAISHMVLEALQAAESLAKSGVSVDVIDPRTIAPLDTETILQSVARTGRLIIADAACGVGGVSAEIACRVSERIPHQLKAPVRRVVWPHCPTPASPALEAAYYPGAKEIISAVEALLRWPESS